MTRTDQRGAAAVEFALIAPLLLLLLMGIISYGYMLSFRQAISQAAAEGARAAAVTIPLTPADEREAMALDAVEEALSSFGVSCDGAMACSVDIQSSCGTGPTAGACVSVELAYDYDASPLTPALPGLGLVMPDRLVYRAAARISQ